MACDIWNRYKGNLKNYIILYFKEMSKIHIDGIEQTKKQYSFANKISAPTHPILKPLQMFSQNWHSMCYIYDR